MPGVDPVDPVDPDQPSHAALVPRSAASIFDAVVARLEDDKDLQVVELDRRERRARFATGSDPSTAAWTFQVEVSKDDDVAALEVALASPPASSLSAEERRRARSTARRFADGVRSVLDRTPPSPAEKKSLAKLPGGGKDPLARLVRRRAPLGALALLAAYAVPVLVVWLSGRAAAAGLLGGARWVPITVGVVLGLGLFVALTVKLGAWAQGVSFGEEYMLTFHPVSGFALAWWRVVVQLGTFILLPFLAANADEEATTRQMTSAETAALPAYAERAPVPPAWEQISASTDQNEYVGRPNATRRTSYGVPGTADVADLEALLRDPGWAEPTDGGEPFGALRDITCDAEYEECTAQVVPPAGRPAEYDVEIRIQDGFDVRMDDGSPGTYVTLEVAYEQAAS
jgi:hypothetical protein